MSERPAFLRHPRDWSPVRLQGQRVLVLGLGRFGGGLGAALHLLDEGARVTVTDLQSDEDLAPILEPLRSRGAELVLGVNRLEDVRTADWIVASPAVPWSATPLREAARLRKPVESEITLLARMLRGPWIGITGTNGKSTTTMLTAHVLNGCAIPARSGGNLGGSLLSEVSRLSAEAVVVLEISSFQLEHLGEIGLGPPIALITNVTPDHLDRHGDFQSYTAAKRSILVRAQTALLNADDPVSSRFAESFTGKILWYGLETAERAKRPGFWLQPTDEAVHIPSSAPKVTASLRGMRLLGGHNRLNLVAASAAATCFGAAFDRAIQAGLDASPLPQRMNEVAVRGGVTFIDDSVSTSPPAVLAALRSFKGGIRLLAGGYDKGIDQRELLLEILQRCSKAYLYGAVAPRLSVELEDARRRWTSEPRQSDIPPATWQVFSDLNAAFQGAASEAAQGDVVLYSPGFASYDQYRNFTERGVRFRALVEQWCRA